MKMVLKIGLVCVGVTFSAMALANGVSPDDGSRYASPDVQPPVAAPAPATPVHPAPPTPVKPASTFNWGRGQNGYGYCYEFSPQGYVLNGGANVENSLCKKGHPSFYNWGQSYTYGYGGCYQFTANGLIMNEGRNLSDATCEPFAPSHYAWGPDGRGLTYCYQFTPTNLVIHGGLPVANSLCY